MATKSRKSRRAAAHKAIADAVKAHKGKDGLVRVFPTEPVGEYRVPGIPAIAQDVEAAEAERLLSYRPAAFTLYESGNPPEEHGDLDALESEQAWGVSDPEDAEDEPPVLEQPTQPESAGDGESQQEA